MHLADDPDVWTAVHLHGPLGTVHGTHIAGVCMDSGALHGPAVT